MVNRFTFRRKIGNTKTSTMEFQPMNSARIERDTTASRLEYCIQWRQHGLEYLGVLYDFFLSQKYEWIGRIPECVCFVYYFQYSFRLSLTSDHIRLFPLHIQPCLCTYSQNVCNCVSHSSPNASRICCDSMKQTIYAYQAVSFIHCSENPNIINSINGLSFSRPNQCRLNYYFDRQLTINSIYSNRV